MRRVTFALLAGLLLFAVDAPAETHIPGGFVSGTWTLAGSPYILDGNIVIHQDSTLTIQPGVDIMMNPGRRFRIEGQILAVGTEQDSIRFIATDTTQGSEGLDFLNTNLSPRDSSKLVYCEIKYGVASPFPDPYMHGGGLHIKNSSRLLVSHCLISHCRTLEIIGANGENGFYGQAGQPGQAIQSGNGGAIYCENSSPVLSFNTISDNRTGDATGGNGGQGGSDGQIELSAFGGAGGAGGSATSGSGGAIYYLNSSAVQFGNIISDNRTGTALGGRGGNGGNAFTWYYAGSATGGNGGLGGAGTSGSGGAVSCDNSAPILLNNLYNDNGCGSGTGGQGGNGGNATAPMGVWPGAGGQGGNGQGGSGWAISIPGAAQTEINYNTCSQHWTTAPGTAGLGGFAGNSGGQAASGMGLSGQFLISGDNLELTSLILWANHPSATIQPGTDVTYSCIEGGFPGTGNINADPIFVTGPQGDYYLSQIAAGQTQQSPAVDAGNPAVFSPGGTTRTDALPDLGIADMGFHYVTQDFGPMLYLPVQDLVFTALGGNPPNQSFLVSNLSPASFNYSLQENLDWLSVSPGGGTVPPPAEITVSIDIAGLTSGTYNGSIAVTAPGAMFSPGEVSVLLNVLAGNLAGPVSGTLNSGVYLVSGNISVVVGDTLTLQPGVTLLFEDDCGLDVFGALQAIGAGSDSIHFQPHPNATNWQGINFIGSNSDLNQLAYCSLRGSISSGISMRNSNLLLAHCRLEENVSDSMGGGIYAKHSVLNAENCAILNNHGTIGAGIYCADTSSAIISGCTIASNAASDKGGGIAIKWLAQGNCIIENCEIRNNTAMGLGGGIHTYAPGDQDTILISHCVVFENQADEGGAIYLGGGTLSRVSNCSIVANLTGEPYGAAISQDIYTATHLSNSVVAFNTTAGFEFDGGVYEDSILYCDFYQNGTNFWGSQPGLGVLSKVNFNGDSCDTYSNIFLDPLFVSLSNGNLNLQSESPCIDAGDPYAPMDPDYTETDMGAYYYPQIGPGVIVCGHAYLGFGINHLGTKVVFQQDSLGGYVDSVQTNLTGYYHNLVPPGIYNVYFSHPGFIAQQLLGQSCLTSPTTLPSVTLQPDSAVTYPISGALSGVLPGFTYIVVDSIFVPLGDSLIIQPGAKFLFNGDYVFKILGHLEALGTATDSIIFRPNDGVPYWFGIRFSGVGSDSSIMAYCRVSGSHRSGIRLLSSSPKIQNCTIADNWLDYPSISDRKGAGFYGYNTRARIMDCDVHHNGNDAWAAREGGGFYLIESDPFIARCRIHENQGDEGSAVCMRYPGLQTFEDCLFEGNGGGDCIFAIYSVSLSLRNCTFSDNSGGTAVLFNGSQLTLLNTIIEGTQGGVGVNLLNSNVTIGYCDFFNNPAGNFSGSGVQPGMGQLSAVNANGDSCDAYYNVFLNPQFVDTTWNDYRLQWGSPCIDAGDPNPVNNDPDGTVADMGAFYYDQSLAVRILLTPHNAPIQIPPGGGSFNFTLQATNIEATALPVTVWCNVTLPSGGTYGPVLGPIGITLGAGATLSRVRTQNVPAGAPAGNYAYNAFAVAAGDTSSDSFAFSKAGAIAGADASGWSNSGEDFGEESANEIALPDAYALNQNFPNPFNATTIIRYALPQAGRVRLEIFNLAGRLVERLVNGDHSAGYHEVTWDASGLPSGMYFFRLQAGSFNAVKELILLK